MKKVLVTGAAGIIGVNVVKYLLSEGKYEITLLDLKNKRSIKRLKKYSKRVNIVYGDINNEILIDALVRDHDVVIHLAGALPPLANFKKDLCRIVDYEGTKNIVNAIRMYNPKCQLLFVSSTTLYGRERDNDMLTIKNDVVIHDEDWYSLYKNDAEKLIKGELKYYTIYRIPIVVGSSDNDLPMYNVPMNSCVEFVSDKDVAYALVASIDNVDKLNKKIFNLSGGEKYRTFYRKHLINLLNIYGLSFRFIVSYLLVDKNFYSGFYDDGDFLEEILNFRNESLDNYYKKMANKYRKSLRIIPRFLAKPIVWLLSRSDK